MVCLGNIYRSPLAEGILKSKLLRGQFVVDSARTSNYHIGQLPNSRSIEIAKKTASTLQIKEDDNLRSQILMNSTIYLSWIHLIIKIL